MLLNIADLLTQFKYMRNMLIKRPFPVTQNILRLNGKKHQNNEYLQHFWWNGSKMCWLFHGRAHVNNTNRTEWMSYECRMDFRAQQDAIATIVKIYIPLNEQREPLTKKRMEKWPEHTQHESERVNCGKKKSPLKQNGRPRPGWNLESIYMRWQMPVCSFGSLFVNMNVLPDILSVGEFSSISILTVACVPFPTKLPAYLLFFRLFLVDLCETDIAICWNIIQHFHMESIRFCSQQTPFRKTPLLYPFSGAGIFNVILAKYVPLILV